MRGAARAWNHIGFASGVRMLVVLPIVVSLLALGTTADRAVAVETTGTMSLSGTVIGLATDGRPLDERVNAEVSVHGLDDDVFVVDRSSPFRFDGLTHGNRYVVAALRSAPYATTYAGGSPTEERAQVFTATTDGITIEQPIGGTVTGDAAYASGWRPQEIGVTAYRLDPASGRYEWVSGDSAGSGGAYSINALYPGTYVLRAQENWQIDVVRSSGDQYWPAADDFEDAEQIVVASGQSYVDRDFALGPYELTSSRIAGADRYETAVRASRAAFDSTVPVVYLASGANWPDALSAAPAASKRGGALLLTAPNGIPDVVKEELLRLTPSEVVVVGSDASISAQVVTQLHEFMPSISVRRIGGVDRFETSRLLVYDAFGPDSRTSVLLTTGLNFPDALSAAPLAGSTGSAVLLVNGSATSLDGPTKALLADLRPRSTEVIGGYPSVSRAFELDLIASGVGGYVSGRDAGVDRYDTSERIGRRVNGGPHGTVFLATGLGFADALGAATAAANLDVPIMLTPPNCLRTSAVDLFRNEGFDRVVLLGGEPTLDKGVQQLVRCT